MHYGRVLRLGRAFRLVKMGRYSQVYEYSTLQGLSLEGSQLVDVWGCRALG